MRTLQLTGHRHIMHNGFCCCWRLPGCLQVQVAKARIAQAEGPYPGNLQAAEHHLKEAVLIWVPLETLSAKPSLQRC